VEEELGRRGCDVFRHSLNSWRSVPVVWELGGELRFTVEGGEVHVTSGTTVWWRRPGWVRVADLDKDEAELMQAEGKALFEGLLRAVSPRWVDEPLSIAAAEFKPWQLVAAQANGISVPPTLVTNVTAKARSNFPHDRFVGKAASSGPGLAPFVRSPTSDTMPLIANAPVLLQSAVAASHDLRVVVLGQRAFAWRRKREPDTPLDWREVDPDGREFVLCPDHPVGGLAMTVAKSLGLSMCVQDWLETTEDLFFLEVNPQGQWLFLRGSRRFLVPALADHLMNHE
jgi:hypothetical protein